MKNDKIAHGTLSRARYLCQQFLWIAREISNIKRGIVSDATFLVTNRCNSKCNICNVWRQTPKYDLHPEILNRVLSSGIVHRDARIVLTGGEVLLHPEYERLIKFATYHSNNVHINTNGLAPEKLKQMVRKYKIKKVMISLDGRPSTYKKIRGLDGYQRTVECIEQLSGMTQINVNFTFTKWSNLDDYAHVMELAKRYKAEFGKINICDELPYLTGECGEALRFEASELPHELIAQSNFPSDYIRWKRGQIKIPCLSIHRRLFVYPNGDVPMCSGKKLILGNLYEKSIRKIWRSKEALSVKKHYTKCNDCWLSCHRPFDVALVRPLQRVFGKRLLHAIIGDYYL